MRRTKVIATLGPATEDPHVLQAIIAAGTDVIRLNAAHAEVDSLAANLALVRDSARTIGRDVAALLDLPGPKVRVGEIAEGTVLTAGRPFRLVAEECVGDAEHACITHQGLSRDVRPGDRVLIDDGRIELVVEECGSGYVMTRVVTGGPLSSNKGVNVPGVTLSVDPISERDRIALAWALEAEVDWIGQSFVRSAGDVHALRVLMGRHELPIIAKIEKHEAVGAIDEIVHAADAVMVARGDLAVETAPEQVPVLQREIVRCARGAGKPVVVATEMLDSMRTRTRPTRAEASDVANAIFLRTDAVMLSGETAIGEHPIEAVETMIRITLAAEGASMPPRPPREHHTMDTVQTAVSSAVCELATDLEAAAILPLTQSGASALAVSRHRPDPPIVAVTPHLSTARRLAFAWGVVTLVTPVAENITQALDRIVAEVRDAGHVQAGDLVALTAGLSGAAPGGTDFIHVRRV